MELAVFLKTRGYRPRQVQDFSPEPMDVATCMYNTGLDPFTMKPVKVAKHLRDRRLQRALMQFFLPENHDTVRKVLRQEGRDDLIGSGPECLVPLTSSTDRKSRGARRRTPAPKRNPRTSGPC